MTLGTLNGHFVDSSLTSNGILVWNGTNFTNYAGPLIDSSGRYRNTTQPAFSAYLTNSLSNVTGDGTVYTILYDTTSLNVGTMYATGTGLATAPIAGNYLFTTALKITTTNTFVTINTAFIINGTAMYIINNVFPALNTTSTQVSSVIIPLSANDTVGCTANATCTASAKNSSITGNGTNRQNSFTGCLLC